VDVETWAILGTALLSALALGLTAWEARQRRILLRVEMAMNFERRLVTEFQDRFYDILGAPDDGVEPNDWRTFLIHFFSYYAHLFMAHRLGVFPRDHWEGLRISVAYWARQPEVADAWQTFRQQADCWPSGFVSFVDEELSSVAPEAERLWARRKPVAGASTRPDLDKDD
jgi:hypothetical protein